MHRCIKHRTSLVVILIGVATLVSPVVHAADVSTTTAPVAASTTRAAAASVGTKELQKEIRAQKTRILQLTKSTEPVSGINRTLRHGSSGKDVRLLQDFLKLYGTFSTSTASSGFFGLQTALAVEEFQHKESIDPIGIVGPKTRARIKALSTNEIAQEKARTASSSAALAPAISNVIFSLDVGEDGSGISSSTVFASTTPNIYAVVALENVRQDTAIGFIRFFNGTYVDSAVTHPSRSGLRYLHIQWSLKPGTHRIPGTYTISWYVDGKKSERTMFTVN